MIALFRSFRPTHTELWVLLVYGAAFHVAHTLAAAWGGPGFFSLWYPPAGLRFALFWVFGARLTPMVALTELLVQIAAGVVNFADPEWLQMAVSVVRPAIVYGVVIGLVVHFTQKGESMLATAPMPFGIAAVLAPICAPFAALPWSLLAPDLTGVSSSKEIISSLSTFATGDLLGVLLLAPPLISLAEYRLAGQRWPKDYRRKQPWVEGFAVFGVGLLASWVLAALDIAESLMPLLLAGTWIGLRFGRPAAWLSNVLVAVIIFPLTAGLADVDGKLDVHMSVAAVAIASYLAASYSTALSTFKKELARRDRLLLHADRLKTLRSMSVAVIHEVSQPLSTLVLEAKHLRESVEATHDYDLIETARIVETKAASLATLTRRLRDFGSRGDEKVTQTSLTTCLTDALGVLSAEVERSGVHLRVEQPAEQMMIRGAGVEITQALLNLLRNAVQASRPMDEVFASLREQDGRYHLMITNQIRNTASPQGMGVGSIIARAIIEAAGGDLEQQRLDNGLMLTTAVFSRDY